MFQGPPGGGPPGPGTPIMPSPQGNRNNRLFFCVQTFTDEKSFRFNPIAIDSSNSGGENMYTLMKPVTGGNMGSVSFKEVCIL